MNQVDHFSLSLQAAAYSRRCGHVTKEVNFN